MKITVKSAAGLAAIAMAAGMVAPAFAQETDKDACGQVMTTDMKVQKALDIAAVQNVASQHEYYHSALDHAGELEHVWAHQTPGISWTNNTDKYVGEASMKRFLIDGLPKDKTGLLWVHLLTTPVIEIAADGKTAKGVWISVGSVTGGMGDKPKSQWEAQWTDEKYGMDFVKENGQWKIWHLRTFVDYYSPVKGSWLKDNIAAPKAQSSEKSKSGKLQAGVKEEPGAKFDMTPDERGTYYLGYSVDTVPVMDPKPPVPYCHFADTTSF
jgi:hypothetical protein